MHIDLKTTFNLSRGIIIIIFISHYYVLKKKEASHCNLAVLASEQTAWLTFQNLERQHSRCCDEHFVLA